MRCEYHDCNKETTRGCYCEKHWKQFPPSDEESERIAEFNAELGAGVYDLP